MSVEREPNLEEVAGRNGDFTLAACQYRQIAHAARIMKQTHWWEVFRRHKLVGIMTEVIERNDVMRSAK